MSGVDTLYLFVPLVPMGKERPRARSIPGRGGGKGFTSIYTPAKTKKWEITGASSISDQLRDMGCPGMSFDGPVQIDVVACFPKGKNMRCQHKRQPCSCPEEKAKGLRELYDKKPDIDNISKIVYDTIQLAGVIHDDAQVIAGTHHKLWAANNEEPGVHIRICRYEGMGEFDWFEARPLS